MAKKRSRPVFIDDEAETSNPANERIPDVQDLEDMSKNELRDILKAHNLKSTGKKPDLLERLKIYIAEAAGDVPPSDSDNCDGPDDIDEDGNIKDLIDDSEDAVSGVEIGANRHGDGECAVADAHGQLPMETEVHLDTAT